MPVILSQKGDYLIIGSICIEATEDGDIFVNTWEGSEKRVLLGHYETKERAKQILEEIFRSRPYYEMPPW